MSRSSIVRTYQDAVVRGDFASFQRIGDWVLWSGIVVPDRCEQERDVALLFGRLSYLSCHRILRGQWRVYEELANELPSLAAEAHRRLVKGPPVPR